MYMRAQPAGIHSHLATVNRLWFGPWLDTSKQSSERSELRNGCAAWCGGALIG